MNTSPELLITELTIERDKFKADLEQAQKDIRDFEILALEWKRNYDLMKSNLEIRLTHAEQIIDDLENDLLECKEMYS